MIPFQTPASTIEIEHARSGIAPIEFVVSAETLSRYLRLTNKNPSEMFSDIPLLETALYQPVSLPPSWLERVEEIIQNSVATETVPSAEEGRWITESVAEAATSFFRETADLLPGEPSIYSSTRGDLVAEFRASRGSLTSIVSPQAVVLYAVRGDEDPVHERLLRTEDIRTAVARVAQTVSDGDLATQK